MKKIEPSFNTETIPSEDECIDKLNDTDALNLMLNNQFECFEVLKKQIKSIEIASNQILNKLKSNQKSRLYYVGSGTSARIAVQDGAELFPTFGWPTSRVKFIVAGGKKSLTKSSEGAEDDVNYAKYLVKLNNLKSSDVVICISASGKTPFTFEVLKIASNIGCLTVSIENNINGDFSKISDCPIILNTGKEIVAGSTRLKAGTSQKICLNLISTFIMTRLGNVKNGLMINMIPGNKKLLKRKEKILKLLKKNDKVKCK
ncbi:N-acetylmuramic acid 6-phosphate etherase [Alphaproteobacteria bacterium]|nr:N-acetylmuramic acid 6-phosphate etherase [Alphaproteobacteria bacterium]